MLIVAFRVSYMLNIYYFYTHKTLVFVANVDRNKIRLIMKFPASVCLFVYLVLLLLLLFVLFNLLFFVKAFVPYRFLTDPRFDSCETPM